VKKLPFVGVENACRSQMVKTFFNNLAGGKAKAVAVMQEIGIDISRQKPKLLTANMVKGAYNVVIAVVAPMSVPCFQWKQKIGKLKILRENLQKGREIREEIRGCVKRVIEKLGLR
jgi:protein-tyrosine-phosphatase